MTAFRPLPLLAFVAWLAAASPLRADTATIDAATVYQRIDGFGASCAYTGTPWSDAQADLFFSVDRGIGLSLLRSKITADVTGSGTAQKMMASSAEISVMQKAIARGARVWATPWSPPAQFKTSGNTVGGSFVSASNQAYADMLADYVANLQSASGIPLYALSIQNEPDLSPSSYEGCLWTGQQFHDFVPYLYAALRARGVGSTRILIPESMHWQSNQALFTPTLNDPAVAPMVGIIANHNYDGRNEQTGATTTPAAPPHPGKALWETEVMTSGTYDGSIGEGVYWAQRIHLFMTAAQANAWHYWWFSSPSSSNSALLGPGGVIPKRVYTIGQFSKFVRPGFYRIAATASGTALVSAYKDPATGAFAIVAINNTATDVTETFTLTHFTATSVTPWLTSGTADLAAQPPLTVSGGAFTAVLPASSVTTFVGTDATPAAGLSSSRIRNLSIRSAAGTGSQTLIAGFVTRGGAKTLLVRGAGPVLTKFNVDNPLLQPTLELVNQDTSAVLATNTGWDAVPNATLVSDTAVSVGAFAFPAGSADCALLTTRNDGSYSARVTGPNGTTGVALIELYDTDYATGGRLVNVSARSQVGTGSNVLIAGFVIAGTEPKTVLIRAVGPTLEQYGVTGVLMNPKLRLMAEDSVTMLDANIGWGSTNPAAIAGAGRNVGAFDLANDSTDSALVATVAPGLYSAVVSGVNDTTGVALVEIYEVK